ncbi:zinc finger protein 79-like [Macrobrachium nipponense]|uniref:zinc finger protein 79-like n=1 Tax=Macrobrachium nipponense TaxID=159736 RepID=UPI0030C8CB0F
MEAEKSSSLLLIKEEKNSGEGLTENAGEGSSFADPFLEVKTEPEFFYHSEFDVNFSSQSIKYEDSSPSCDNGSRKMICIAEESRYLGGGNASPKRCNTAGKQITCAECQRTFSYMSHLKSHMRTHTGEKPFSCCKFQRSFSHQGALTKHMRTHTGEKPYTCSICQRSYFEPSYLTKHMRTHTGEKPYTCSICQRSFSESSFLTKHKKTHTGEKSHTCPMLYMPKKFF